MNTRSVNAWTAKSVSPTVAIFCPPSSATATHSCVLANNSLSGFTIALLVNTFFYHRGHRGHGERMPITNDQAPMTNVMKPIVSRWSRVLAIVDFLGVLCVLRG